MNRLSDVDAELAKHDWSSLRVCGGPGTEVPEALRAMVSATSAEQVEQAYWQLENRVVVQGQLYTAAVPATRVIMAALGTTGLPSYVRNGLLELLFQIVSGESHESEVGLRQPDLGSRCRSVVKERVAVLEDESLCGNYEAAKEVVSVVAVVSNY